jgi:hypothetical protein
MNATVLPVSPRYRDAVWFVLRPQIVVALICLLVMDGGMLAKVCGFTMLGFWGGVFYCMARRPLDPRTTDLLYVRWGFWPLLIGAIAAAETLIDWAGRA